jgi:hypothetical protein
MSFHVPQDPLFCIQGLVGVRLSGFKSRLRTNIQSGVPGNHCRVPFFFARFRRICSIMAESTVRDNDYENDSLLNPSPIGDMHEPFIFPHTVI